MKQGNKKSAAIMGTMLFIPVLYIALVLATVYRAGMNLFEIMTALETVQYAPSRIQFTAYTLRFVIVAALLYTLAALFLCSAQQNRREGEEHGSARWGSPQMLSRKYRERDFWKNVILTQNVLMGLDGHKHRRNLLQIVVGGSGSGKSQNVVLPNLMLVNASYIVTDPKGELLRTVAPLLLREGYVIRVFDLVDMEHSDCFNPFAYIRTDTDVLKLVSNLIKNTTPKGSHQNDPFWEKAEIALDSAIMFYLLYEAPENECTLEMVMHMLNNAGAKEEDNDYQSPLDLLFDALEEEQPDHIAVKQYNIYKQAAGKTAKSIIISAAVRLAAFNIPAVRRITDVDEMEIGKLGASRRFSASSRTATMIRLIILSACSTPVRFKSCTIWQTANTAGVCRSQCASSSTNLQMSLCQTDLRVYRRPCVQETLCQLSSCKTYPSSRHCSRMTGRASLAMPTRSCT